MDDLSRIPKGKEELWSIRELPQSEVLPSSPACAPRCPAHAHQAVMRY